MTHDADVTHDDDTASTDEATQPVQAKTAPTKAATTKGATKQTTKARPQSHVTTLDDDPAEDDEEQEIETVPVTDHGDRMSGEKWELTLHAGDGEIGRQAVFFGINSHGFNIPRSVPVIVPVEVINVLDDATMDIYEKVGDKMVSREVKRFSYTARPVTAMPKGKR